MSRILSHFGIMCFKYINLEFKLHEDVIGKIHDNLTLVKADLTAKLLTCIKFLIGAQPRKVFLSCRTKYIYLPK